MGTLVLFEKHGHGPRVIRLHNCAFEVLGVGVMSPEFKYRDEAEAWLKKHMEKVPAAKRPKERPCITCTRSFLSEGAHNRMCDYCRRSAAGVDTGAHRLVRPSKRG